MTRKPGLAIGTAARTRARIFFGIGAVAAIATVGCRGLIGEGEGPSPMPPGNIPVTDLPCEVETVLSGRCWACHGQTPSTLGVPSLTSVAAFTAASLTDPSRSTGEVAVARMQATTLQMPPPPAAPATADEIAVLSNWVAAGYPSGTGCGPICTSGTTWTGGNEGSPNMNPGMACNACHTISDEGPSFSVSGTVYPTVHEPDLCNGVASGSNGARVVITGADGHVLTLAPNAVGNFYSEVAVAAPYSAKVVDAAGERAMTATQTSGDCNSCHTQVGANGAPGRIMLP